MSIDDPQWRPLRFCSRCGAALGEREVGGRARPACPACGFVVYVDPKLACGVLIEQAGRVLLVRRRHEPGRGLWCLPCGFADADEPPDQAARREAREEAGATLGELVALPHYVVSPGCSDETVRLFCARVDSRGAGGVHGRADEHEDIRVLVLPVEEALARCADGRIASSLTLIALYWLALNRDALDRRWLDATPARA